MNKIKDNKIEDKFCPKCGLKLVLVRENNEVYFPTTPFWSYGYSVDRAGEKYDSKTGKRMYRTEYHCPTKEIYGGLFCRKMRSHYVILGETNLTD